MFHKLEHAIRKLPPLQARAIAGRSKGNSWNAFGTINCQSYDRGGEGRLSVVSEVGVGSTFTLYLPVAEDNSETCAVGSAAGPGELAT